MTKHQAGKVKAGDVLIYKIGGWRVTVKEVINRPALGQTDPKIKYPLFKTNRGEISYRLCRLPDPVCERCDRNPCVCAEYAEEVASGQHEGAD